MNESMIMPSDIKNPEAFLEFRASSASEINDRICEKFMTDGIIDRDAIMEIFGNDQGIIERIVFVLQSFARPKDESKMRRKDGSPIATHSLQLFRAAKDYYKIQDDKVGRAVLVHDLIEDTRTTKEDITNALGQEDAALAELMTEVELDEESRNMAGNESGILSIAKFIHKLKTGGETISKAEVLDRMDDISDLEYITKKLSDPETKEKAIKSLEDKFAKCSFTVEALVDENASNELISLIDSFRQLVAFQKKKIEEAFNVAIDQEKIDSIKLKYLVFFNESAVN